MRNFFLGAVGAAFLTAALVASASRNSSGTMSSLNGPYQPGTTISSSIINNRYADIEAEITDSLSRSGKGGMTSNLRGIDGTVASPALSFTSEPGSGLYRIGAGDLGLAVLGVKISEWTSTAFKPALTTQSINGLVSAPSYSFVNDTGSGLYRGGASDLRFAVAGADKTFWNAAGYGIGTAPTYPLDVGIRVGGTTGRFTASGTVGVTMMARAAQSGIGFNAHHDDTNWVYETTNPANMIVGTTGGDQIFYTAPSGTAGNNATITERARINSSGLTIGASGTAIGNLSFGTCTLNGASPSTCTVTVTSGTTCMCSPQITGTFTGAACSVTATTATCTSGNAFTNTALVIAVK